MSRTTQQQEIASRMFDQFRDDLMKRDLSNTESYDRAILTVSTTFLGASIAFIKFVVPFDQALYLPLLVSCWALLFLALTCSIWAYRVGNQAIAIKLIQARQYYIEGDESAFDNQNRYAIFNNQLNSAAGGGLVLAMLLLIFFVSINVMTEEVTMAKDVPQQQTILAKKSANVPTMEKIPTAGDNIGNSANVPTMEQVPSTVPPSQSGPVGSKK